jgi:hypothetical protein
MELKTCACSKEYALNTERTVGSGMFSVVAKKKKKTLWSWASRGSAPR